MREFRLSGSVRGALGNGRPYREHEPERRLRVRTDAFGACSANFYTRRRASVAPTADV